MANEVLTEFITDFVQFLNVGKIMNVSQIKQTTYLIIQYFPHLNLADFKVFFEKLKLGHFGKFYDSVDGQLILSKIEEYNQERMNEFERVKTHQHNIVRKEENLNISFHPTVIEALKRAVGEKPLITIDKGPERTPTEAEKFYQRCMRQFDNLYRKYGKEVSTVRFLVFSGKRYTLDTFIERKINNVINSLNN
ncbi:DUF6633 family protein [Sphingobacterium thalpophilum]|uniref:DUF6633 family protein n=1 Tax=Sphingobacterium thalpophilum TaxID=259 RepID=UPI0024A62219|nr:DUF6633 family protein [Sphingobacterium thalpophilum]